MLKGTSREAAAEFLGTFILIVFGVGVVAQTVLESRRQRIVSRDQHRLGTGRDARASTLSGGVSGAHLNPGGDARAGGDARILLGQGRRRSSSRRWPARLSPSAVVYLTYREAFDAFDGGVRQVARRAGHGRDLRDLSATVSVDRWAASSIRSSARRC